MARAQIRTGGRRRRGQSEGGVADARPVRHTDPKILAVARYLLDRFPGWRVTPYFDETRRGWVFRVDDALEHPHHRVLIAEDLLEGIPLNQIVVRLRAERIAPRLREVGLRLVRLTDEGVQTEPALPRESRGGPGGAMRVVVQRGRREVYDALSTYWAQNRHLLVQMVWDRRAHERRAKARPVAAERRRADRRRPPPEDWPWQGFLVVVDPVRPDPPTGAPSPLLAIDLLDGACHLALRPSLGGAPLHPETRLALERAPVARGVRAVTCTREEARDLLARFRAAAEALNQIGDPRAVMCHRAFESVRQALGGAGFGTPD
jgi:hypothetical protein